MKQESKTRKLTIKYWNSLPKSSKERALKHVFPIAPAIVKMLLDDEPTTEEIKNGFWKLVFQEIKEVNGDKYYKTCFMNTTYIP